MAVNAQDIFSMPIRGSLNPRPVLDLCLLRLQPILRKQTLKKDGLKMTQTTLDFTIDNKGLDLETFTVKQRSFMIDEVGDLPNWFDRKEYIERYWKNINNFLLENKDLKRQIDGLKENKISNEKRVEVFKPLLDKLYDVLINISPQWYTVNMAEFLESDLPFDLYDMYNISFLNRLIIIDVIRHNISNLLTRLHVHRSDETKSQHDVSYFTNQMEHLMIARMAASDAEDLIRFYIKLANAENMDEMFVVKPLSMKKMNMDKFGKYFHQYSESTTALSKTLKEYLPQVSLPQIAFPESHTIPEFQHDLGQYVLKYE